MVSLNFFVPLHQIVIYKKEDMEQTENKYLAVAYTLYKITNGQEELVEEAPEDKPFCFISGFGTTIERFESNVIGLETNGTFDFTLSKQEAYGHFDHDNIYVDAIIPLQNEDGNRFNGRVLDISDDKVKVDLNHPLAGCDLHFVGKIVENREATKDEIQSMLNALSGEGSCGCGCGSCGCEEGDGHEGCHHGHEHHHHHGHGHDGRCGCH